MTVFILFHIKGLEEDLWNEITLFYEFPPGMKRLFSLYGVFGVVKLKYTSLPLKPKTKRYGITLNLYFHL